MFRNNLVQGLAAGGVGMFALGSALNEGLRYHLQDGISQDSTNNDSFANITNSTGPGFSFEPASWESFLVDYVSNGGVGLTITVLYLAAKLMCDKFCSKKDGYEAINNPIEP